jgi:hypothetical protein
MPEQIAVMVTDQWKPLLDLLAIPIAWIPGMQRALLGFVLLSGSGAMAVVYYLLLLFPVLLWISAIWCTQLSIYSLPFRSGRVDFIKQMLMAWWDAALAVWMFWTGLARFVMVIMGWVFELGRLGLRFLVEVGRQVVMLPFTVTGRMTQSYFQPGIPWIAFMSLIVWCLLEATIFTYTLMPTITEVVAGITGLEAPPYTGPALFLFLFALIAGSFACIQVLAEAFKNREYRFLVQALVVELFVMTFEVMFLYRELVDAITPWIAHQTSEQFRPGIGFTLTLATFGWAGVRGMTWFLFGQYGTPPLLAFMARRPLVPQAAEGELAGAPVLQKWWRQPVEEFKQEIGWLHSRGEELMDYLALPFAHVVGAAVNFGMILVSGRPVFSIPFKSLKEILETRETLAAFRLRPKKEAA